VLFTNGALTCGLENGYRNALILLVQINSALAHVRLGSKRAPNVRSPAGDYSSNGCIGRLSESSAHLPLLTSIRVRRGVR
jgi:hypothetical protein